MKKFLTVWGLLLFISITSYSQEKKYALYSVAFYNLENLFDTIHDAGKNDFEYLPNGKNKWNSMKYDVRNIKSAIDRQITIRTNYYRYVGS